MRIVTLLIFLIFSGFSNAQKNDYVWILGGSSRNIFTNGFQWGTAIADFKEEPVQFRYDSTITMDLQGTNGNISDNDGQLLMYSNGMHVHNRFHKTIAGLDTISYSPYWENFNLKDYLPDGSDWKSGFPGDQWLIMLPNLSLGSYYLFYPKIEIAQGYLHFKSILSSKVDFTNNSNGQLIFKDNIVSNGNFQMGINAIKHANGRDWWLIHGEEFNRYYNLYLLSNRGVNHIHRFDNGLDTEQRRSYYHGYFSPRGDKYVTSAGVGLVDSVLLSIYDFDRCSGKLTKVCVKNYKRQNLYGSVSFSPDGKYMYTTDGQTMYQYDMDTNPILSSEQIVAKYDGSVIAYYDNALYFGSMATGPDGRIYCIPPGASRSIHTIEYPDENGVDATMLQNSISLSTQNFNSIPNFPHFRLGPLDGSPCDTLDMDNIPVAKFRFEQDTSDHLRLRFTDLSYFRAETWTWDFADGTTFSGRKPYWHRFPAEGNYKVCLTVSNENGQNTYCKTIQIGATVNTSDVDNSDGKVNIFPNPAEYDLMVTLSDYVPAYGQIFIYDLMGREVLNHKIYYGQNSVDISTLPAGSYIYKVTDGAKHLGEGKFVKSE
jgi:PKD repeat protein